MSYEDLNKARAERAAKEAKKAAKAAKKAACHSKAKAPLGIKKSGRKKKNNVTVSGTYASEPKVAQIGEKQVAESEQEVSAGGLGWMWEQGEIVSLRQRAPIAPMW